MIVNKHSSSPLDIADIFLHKYFATADLPSRRVLIQRGLQLRRRRSSSRSDINWYHYRIRKNNGLQMIKEIIIRQRKASILLEIHLASLVWRLGFLLLLLLRHARVASISSFVIEIASPFHSTPTGLIGFHGMSSSSLEHFSIWNPTPINLLSELSLTSSLVPCNQFEFRFLISSLQDTGLTFSFSLSLSLLPLPSSAASSRAFKFTLEVPVAFTWELDMKRKSRRKFDSIIALFFEGEWEQDLLGDSLHLSWTVPDD